MRNSLDSLRTFGSGRVTEKVARFTRVDSRDAVGEGKKGVGLIAKAVF